MKKKTLLLLLAFWFVSAEAYSADPVTWAKVYGGSSTDYFQDICPTSDGGYIATGWTRSYGRGQDVWVVKLDSYGGILWQKAYGTSANEEAKTPHSIQQAADGGYIVAANCGGDFWMLKLDSFGEIEWQKKYGGAKNEFAWAVQTTADGGYIITGTTFSYNASSGSVFDADVWVLRLDNSGNVVWEKSYGGEGAFQFEMAFAVQQTLDGGFVVSAYTYAWATTSSFSAWVLKLYENGEIEWQKAYGGGGDMDGDFLNFVTQTSDGNYILTGNTMSWSPGPYNSYDYTNVWAVKLNASGNVIWSKAYGGVELKADGGSSIEEIADGNYIISGLTRSFGNSSTENLYDLWVLKIDPDGDIIWEKAYGGTKEDGQCRNGSSIRQTSDGGFILSSDTASFSSSGTTDAWALKLDADGNISGADMLITDTSATVTTITDLVTVVSNAVPLVTNSTVTDTNVVPTQTTAVPVSLCEVIPDASPTIESGPFLAAGVWPVLPTSSDSPICLEQNEYFFWTFIDDYAVGCEDCTHVAEYQAVGDAGWTGLGEVVSDKVLGYAYVELPITSLTNATTYAFRFSVIDCASQGAQSQIYYFRVARYDDPPTIELGPFLATGVWPVLSRTESRAFVIAQDEYVLWSFSDDYATCSDMTWHRARYHKIVDDGTWIWEWLDVSTDSTEEEFAYVSIPASSMEAGTYMFITEIVDCAGQLTRSTTSYFKVE